jgi:two-component system sensor histidine kinase UhpB
VHDELGNLAVLKLYLGQVAAYLDRGRTTEALRKVGEAAAVVSETIEAMRRVIMDRAPAPLERGLCAAVRLAAREVSARAGIVVRVRHQGVPPRLPPAHETALFRLVQGALSNVLRHSRARSATVTLAWGPAVVLIVDDDGVGFSVRGRGSAGRFGLQAMRERAAARGGRFDVHSWPAPRDQHRRGTRIRVTLPLPPGDFD